MRISFLVWSGSQTFSGPQLDSRVILSATGVFVRPHPFTPCPFRSLIEREDGTQERKRLARICICKKILLSVIGKLRRYADPNRYIKCFFALNGHLTTRSVFSPASHSNVHSNGKGFRGFIDDLKARYKQALRHMWGSLDSGFVLKSMGEIWRKPKDGKR